MKKYRFFYSPQSGNVNPSEEIVEFDNDTTEEEIQEVFTEWVFGFIDTAYERLDN